MNYREKILERKTRWNGLMNNAPGHKRAFVIECPFETKPRPFPRQDNWDERIEWGVGEYLAQKNRVEWLDDDNIPHINPYTGTEIFAEAFGCRVHYPEDGMPFALPLFDDAKEAARVKIPNMWETNLAGIFEAVSKMRSMTDGDAVVKLPDIQSPMDIAALILNKEAFLIALTEEPEYVAELAGKVLVLLTRFADEWFRAFGRELVAHYPNYYMESGFTFSEDEVGIVSGGMFKAYFAKELAFLAEMYGNLGMHCCADARHQWENFKSIPNLKFLNLCRPWHTVSEAYEYFEDFCVQAHIWDGEPEAWKKGLPQNARIVFTAKADSKEEAIGMAAQMRRG